MTSARDFAKGWPAAGRQANSGMLLGRTLKKPPSAAAAAESRSGQHHTNPAQEWAGVEGGRCSTDHIKCTGASAADGRGEASCPVGFTRAPTCPFGPCPTGRNRPRGRSTKGLYSLGDRQPAGGGGWLICARQLLLALLAASGFLIACLGPCSWRKAHRRHLTYRGNVVVRARANACGQWRIDHRSFPNGWLRPRARAPGPTGFARYGSDRLISCASACLLPWKSAMAVLVHVDVFFIATAEAREPHCGELQRGGF